MKIYRLAPAGRRTTLVLLAGALLIWVFAIWTLRSTLAASAADAPTVGQIVPALIMVVLIVATPLVVWNLLEEWAATYEPSDEGLRFRSLGVDITYPWQAITGIRAVDDDSEEPMDELTLDADYTAQVGNPVLRFLHAQAYGRRKLPIYANLADREELVAEVRRRAGVAAADGAAPQPAV